MSHWGLRGRNGLATAGIPASPPGSKSDASERLKDGTYNIHLGFHKAGVPTPQDLVVRTNGFRAIPVVNQNQSIPVISNLSTKATSNGIHFHNGYNTWTAAPTTSEGCVILHPSDWSAFIKKFLDKFTNIDDSKCLSDRVGKKLGTLVIGP